MQSRFVAFLLVAIAVAASHAQAALTVQDPALQEVAGLFEQWNAALLTLDPEAVADMYHNESVLLPTVSNEVRTDRASKVDYFEKFLKLQPVGSLDESYVRWASDENDTAINSGIYTFNVTQDGKPSQVQARYTFVYRLGEDGVWKISEHHSSAMPEPVGPEDKLNRVAGLFDKWNAALQTGDPEKVADLYADDAVLSGTGSVLLPTVSNIPRTDRAGRVDYFVTFLAYGPVGSIDESHVRWVSDKQDTAINSGIYTFDLQKEGRKVQARYTFVYRLIDGEWKIIEHHSSAMPEPTTTEEDKSTAGRRLLL